MIDSQSTDQALGQKFFDEPVGGLKYLGALHADRGQFVDVEKTPIVDFVGGHLPVRKPIRLIQQQLVEQIETRGVAARPVEIAQRLVEKSADLRRSLTQFGETSADDFLFTAALVDPFGIGLGPGRKVRQRKQDTFVFLHLRMSSAQSPLELVDAVLENQRPRMRCDGKSAV